MTDERPNVQVIYTSNPPPAPGLGAVLLELLVFLVTAGLIALLAGGGCRALL